jgi:hypothetical protein
MEDNNSLSKINSKGVDWIKLAQVGFRDSGNETMGSIRDGNFFIDSLSMFKDNVPDR